MNYSKRGEIWLVSLNPIIGAELGKIRPAVIISNDKNNEYGGTITVIPITSNIKKIYPFDLFLPKNITGLTKDSKAKCNQIRTINKKRFIKKIGDLTYDLISGLEQALLIHLYIH